jgi:RND family efflux transporter MFP subunit
VSPFSLPTCVRPENQQTSLRGNSRVRARIARTIAFQRNEATVPGNGSISQRSNWVWSGADEKSGDLLYKLERAPFEAEAEAKQGAVAQARAQLENANLTLARAQQLLQKPAGTQVAVDSAKRTLDAQLQSARAQLHQSQIKLDYTEIRSPIDGRIGRTSVTIGNVVSPTSGVLTIVSTDPMYAVFPIAMRQVLELRDRFVDIGGFGGVDFLADRVSVARRASPKLRVTK